MEYLQGLKPLSAVGLYVAVETATHKAAIHNVASQIYFALFLFDSSFVLALVAGGDVYYVEHFAVVEPAF